MIILLNGEKYETSAATVVELVAEYTGTDGAGVAVAIDGDVVSRDAWDTALEVNCRVDMLTAVQGG